jgi:CubicO group peptidase (beta-lactamase class C family)
MRRLVTTAFALLLALGIGMWIVAGRDLAYLVRVLRHRDASTDDYRWKRSAGVDASAPVPWPNDDRCGDVERAWSTADPDRPQLTDWLTDGGALSFVVVQHGTIVCEWHGDDRRSDEPAALNSITKIVTSLLLARAIDSGHIGSLDDAITEYVPELLDRDPRFAEITLANLVDMRSGIGFSESTGFPWVNQDAPAVYYASDLERTVIERPTIAAPPGVFQYNDYAPNLIGLALERSGFGRASGGPIADLWSELGAEHDALWSVDDHGFPWHESGFVAVATDIARIGRLMLDGGLIEGRRVAPGAFVERSWAAADAGSVTVFDGTSVGYGNGWWTLPRTEGGNDLVAMGRHGQVMLVSAATDTVVVRLGEDGHPETNISIARRLQSLADRLDG